MAAQVAWCGHFYDFSWIRELLPVRQMVEGNRPIIVSYISRLPAKQNGVRAKVPKGGSFIW